MNELSRKGLDAYYAEAASWNRDRVQALRSSRRVSWWIAAVAAAIALLEAVALVVLMPLKRVEPYTLMVDRTTGFVQALKPLDPASVAPDTALTQSFLVQYVSAREGFDIATLNADYRKVALLSSGAARSTYVSAMQASNPASPLALYPRSTVLDETYKVALTRFDQRIRVGGMAELAGFDLTLRTNRRRTLERVVEDLFPGAATLERGTFWTGLRPMTPDGTPMIGPTRFDRLWLNTGHGTLGWTMACGSGQLLADLIQGRSPAIRADDLGIDRYSGRHPGAHPQDAAGRKPRPTRWKAWPDDAC